MDYSTLKHLIPKRSDLWNDQDINTWLTFLTLTKLAPIFKINHINGSNLKYLKEDTLRNILNTKSNLTIKKLMAWIQTGLKQFDKELPKESIIEEQKIPNLQISNKENIEQIGNMMEVEVFEDKKKYQLVLQQPSNTVFVYYSIDENGGRLGRLTTNKVCIPHQDISREHAEIIFLNGIFYVQDLGSHGGTYIKLQEQLELREGMIFEVGSAEFEVHQFGEHICLYRKDEENNSQRYDLNILEGNKIRIGRNGDKGFNFPADTIMSNTHCIIYNRNGRYFISDNCSTNGTWIRLSAENQRSLEYPLQDNTYIRLSDNIIYRVEKKECLKPVLKRNERECRICFDAEKDCVIMPCKHYNFCTKCSKHFRSCPICRNPIEQIMKIYHQ